jgi:hypothetical protein
VPQDVDVAVVRADLENHVFGPVPLVQHFLDQYSWPSSRKRTGRSSRSRILLTHCPFFQARKSRLVAQAASAYRLLAYTRRAIISSIVGM